MGPTILAIETSCDETAAAVIKNGALLSNVVATQAIHELYGGVVPELASRAHMQLLLPVVKQALAKANVSKNELDAVAFTQGPGLLGALLIGSSFAKAFALALNKPLLPVNHMLAHILAHFIEEPKPEFPFLCLTVSGGHTQLVRVDSALEVEIIGQTIDDAVGEAFDKAAKLLGLPYPGGPLLDKLAATGDSFKYRFADTRVPGLDFSFSGIKTSFLNFLNQQMQHNPEFITQNLSSICASLQRHLVDMLMKKLEAAAEQTGITTIALAGGVSANSALRKALSEKEQTLDWKTFVPRLEYCTDNAAMIAVTAHYMYLHNKFGRQDSSPEPRMKL